MATIISFLRLIIPFSAQNSPARETAHSRIRRTQVLCGKPMWRGQKPTIRSVVALPHDAASFDEVRCTFIQVFDAVE